MYDKQLPKHRTLMPIIRDLVMAVVERGHHQLEFCQRIGLSAEELQQEDAWVDLDTGHKVWQEAIAVTQDPYLGLHIGQKSNVSVAGMVAYLIQSCPDLLTAFSKMCEYNATYTTVFDYAIEQKPPNEVWMSYTPVSEWVNNYPVTAQQAIETSMARTCAILRLLSGKSFTPQRACFSYALNKDLKMYHQLLCQEVEFGCSQNLLIFALDDLQHPVLTANKALQTHFEQMLQTQLTAQKPHVWAHKVREAILAQPINIPPLLQAIAEKLHLSTRSLQRKLKDEGHTFLAIANDIQEQRAVHLLRQTQLNISEVAYMLGYAEPSVFRRAFKRWTGKTPKEYLKN